MTTKPKARKFRIRRTAPLGGPAAEAQAQAEIPPMADARASSVPRSHVPPSNAAPSSAPQQAGTPRPTAPQTPQRSAAPLEGNHPRTPTPSNAAPAAPQQPQVQPAAQENTIETIKREGLTGRQLRMARRLAQKHGLAAVSDFDSVRLLRAKGIDPFQRSNMLELVVPPNQNATNKEQIGDLGGVGGEEDQLSAQLPVKGQQQLPQTMQLDKNQLPSTELSPAERRSAEIQEIQEGIKARRRRKMTLLLTRLSFFVFLPTILAGWYFFAIATPMYSVKSEFLILQADNAGGGGFGQLLKGSSFATTQDSTATQSFLQSKDAMIRLDEQSNFIAHFSQDWIDPIQRLGTDASNEEAYKLFKKFVKIGYDPTEGVIRMEVAAADPQIATEFSEQLITFAEQRIDDLSRRKREDGMETARVSLEQAKRDRREAQMALVRLQEGSLVDPEGVIASMRTQIGNVELQLQEKELQLAALKDNQRPNRAKVDGATGDVRRLNELLVRLNRKMTKATTGEKSLAEQAVQIQMAQADLVTADLFLQSALTNEKQTALEANRQVRYLTTSVRPVPSQDPAFPRSFENTILAFLIMAGIYLMISLTASILREQVSS